MLQPRLDLDFINELPFISLPEPALHALTHVDGILNIFLARIFGEGYQGSVEPLLSRLLRK